MDKVEKQLDAIKNRLSFLAAEEVLRGIVELTERFAAFAEEIHVAAESAGITVEAFQKLAFAAGQSAVSQDEMSHAMARLGRQLYEARRGGEMAQKAFSDVGITPQQIAGIKTSSDALLILADRFHTIQDPIQKQALGLQLMGRSSLNMVGFLSQGSAAIRGMGSEADKLGIVLTGKQINALVAVEHALQKLWGVLRAVGATFASYLGPSIKSAIDDFLKFYAANKKIIDTNIREWVYDLTYALGFVYEAVKFVAEKFLEFASTHQLLVRRVGEFILVLFGFVGVLWTLKTVVGFVSAAFGILNPLFSFFVGLFEFATAPVGLFIIALGALVVILHDVWKLLTGGSFADTWIGEAFNAVKNFGGKAIDFLFGGAPGQSPVANASNNLSQVGSFIQPNPSFSTSSSQSSNAYSVNAPINQYFSPGADPKTMGEKVQEGIKNHLDSVNRRTQHSLAIPEKY